MWVTCQGKRMLRMWNSTSLIEIRFHFHGLIYDSSLISRWLGVYFYFIVSQGSDWCKVSI